MQHDLGHSLAENLIRKVSRLSQTLASENGRDENNGVGWQPPFELETEPVERTHDRLKLHRKNKQR